MIARESPNPKRFAAISLGLNRIRPCDSFCGVCGRGYRGGVGATQEINVKFLILRVLSSYLPGLLVRFRQRLTHQILWYKYFG